jgi:hypothetical protein
MAQAGIDWKRDHQLWIEVFVLFNLAGLSADIFLAHSQNRFANSLEYIPLIFSIAATGLLALVLVCRQRWTVVWRDVGHLIGWLAILVGLGGVVLHLDSRFFEERTIRSLTYAAPFAAPLAYTGLGLLLIANRLVPPEAPEWPRWVLLLTMGGFIGNFVFSLTDHAQNGFFNPAEWIPVVSSAFAIGFLVVPFLFDVNDAYLRLCVAVLAVQALIGVAGFVFHALSVVRQPAQTLFERLMTGAPPLAPMLFPNLAVLALLALQVLGAQLRAGQQPRV